jgi:hypothetical protein
VRAIKYSRRKIIFGAANTSKTLTPNIFPNEYPEYLRLTVNFVPVTS